MAAVIAGLAMLTVMRGSDLRRHARLEKQTLGERSALAVSILITGVEGVRNIWSGVKQTVLVPMSDEDRQVLLRRASESLSGVHDDLADQRPFALEPRLMFVAARLRARLREDCRKLASEATAPHEHTDHRPDAWFEEAEFYWWREAIRVYDLAPFRYAEAADAELSGNTLEGFRREWLESCQRHRERAEAGRPDEGSEDKLASFL